MSTESQGYAISEQKKVEAAYALNLCTVSLTQIIDYSDPYILEQEYDAILNNLNIQNIIHDEAMLTLIKKILESLTFYRIQEGDKKFLDQEYQGKMKSAIWSAVPSLSVILAGGNFITAAVAVASQIGIGYMNYRKATSQNKQEKEKKEWELKRSLIEEVSGLQRQLFETAWRLSDRYNFDDKYRLTEKQIKQYSLILMDPDPLRRYERLDTQKEIFNAFPPFWYYKGNSARDIAAKYSNNPEIVSAYKAKALDDYRKFDSIYIELMREDVIAASCAIEHIALLDKTKDTEETKKLLDRVMRFAGNNFDVLQIAVLNYLSLGENDKAKNILRRLVNENYNIGLNGLLLSRIYCKLDKNKIEYDILQDRIGVRNVIPWIENDDEADKKYIESREDAICRHFGRYIDAFGVKYRNLFLESLCYDKTSRLKKQVEWCLWVDVTKSIVNISNAFFDELIKNEVFPLVKRNDKRTWKDFFIENTVPLNEKLKKIKEVETKVKNAVIEIMKHNPFGILDSVDGLGDAASKVLDGAGKAFDNINNVLDGKLNILKSGASAIGNITGKALEGAGKAMGGGESNIITGNEAEQEKLKSAIKVLLKNSDFEKYIADFFSAIKEDFRKHLTVETVVSLQESMLIVINKWYSENGFQVTTDSIDDSDFDIRVIGNKEEYFSYPN
jgi:hypothetical protein